MITQQNNWFEKLQEIRKNDSEAFSTFSLRNMWDSVTEKYSDKAHFIYELLQNANDALASKSFFYLTKEGLFFKHNGTKHFWVSDPNTEFEDQDNNRLGDINAITAVAQSNKKDNETIGKFGVGFKAVYQYTDTPHIYDKNFRFKIEKYIVPVKLDKDLSCRQENETVFYFPFNKAEMPAVKAYSDIVERLKSLVYPTLFSNNLKEVSWKTEDDAGGIYLKNTIESKRIGDMVYEKIELKQNVESKTQNERILLFSRSLNTVSLSYAIGYFINETDTKIIPKSIPAFCYFPTKETTNLNFIIHAPFLLNDSREGIKQDQPERWNENLIMLLAQLAADSLPVLSQMNLIDDDFFINIIPYNKTDFYNYDYYYDYNTPKFYAPFYDKIKEKLETTDLLPSINGEYTNRKNAYWASAPTLSGLFSNEQLATLFNNESAKWVFPNLGYTYIQGANKELASYISELVGINKITPQEILGKITHDFTINQKIEWLHELYDYLSENKSYQEYVKTKPIFIDHNGNASPAYEYNSSSKKNELVLFLPEDNEESADDLKTINKKLLENEKSREFILNFGIKLPDLKDRIYNHILPLYKTDAGINTRPHFKLFLKYWKENGQPEDIIERIKDTAFILYKNKEDNVTYRGVAEHIYYPSPELEKYFESKPDTIFVDLDEYHQIIDPDDKLLLKDFLIKLGVNEIPRILDVEIRDPKVKENLNLHISTNGYYDRNKTTNRIIDGCSEILDNIDKEKSILLWDYLGKLQHYVSSNNNVNSLRDKLTGTHAYFFYYRQYYQSFESIDHTRLKKEKWLLTKDNKFVAPHEIAISDLAEEYEKNSDLESFLEFKPTVVLSEKEQIGQLFNNLEEAKEAKELLEKHKQLLGKKSQNLAHADQSIQGILSQIENSIDNNNPHGHNYDNNKDKSTTTVDQKVRSIDELLNNYSFQENSNSSTTEVEKQEEINDYDSLSDNNDVQEDEEFSKMFEEIKTKFENDKVRKKLKQNLSDFQKYSYNWFKIYLELLATYSEKQDYTHQKSISFQEIKAYKNDKKYFLLRNSNNYISPEIENAEDIKITLIYGNGEKENVIVEGVSKKGQELLIYIREGLSERTLNRLPFIYKVTINFTPVINLIDRLFRAFTNPNNIDSWNEIHEIMPSLNYIYGPPGTGKTTKLCNLIDEILNEEPKKKILVLTPTNKAADVVCKRLLNININTSVIRLSSPTDPELDEEIYCDVLEFDDRTKINVVATTIHRLPYFEINNAGFLFKTKWDYVIFDESSMIGLPYITFAILALSKTNVDTHFIISGDPKQIPPVVEIDDKELEGFDFQDENIYKMMGLESFNPSEQKIRQIDSIENLGTQYRSTPTIGQIFSELSYSGLLKHNKDFNSCNKSLPESFKKLLSSNITFIDFPLSKENTIFKVNKLIYSSYHLYSAILVAEMIKHFDSENNENWSIGVIAPYKAQAILINKLITSYNISENTNVYSDTVHGFQGDECDIVFFICNPNNYYYTGNKKALLSKEYIYNVAISRAKEYLIILHPFSKIPDNKFINKICYSYKTNFGNTIILSSSEIEKNLFNEKNFIEKNSYISGHDSVNIFGYSEMKYFIKANDTAIDIQLQKNQHDEENDWEKVD